MQINRLLLYVNKKKSAFLVRITVEPPTYSLNYKRKKFFFTTKSKKAIENISLCFFDTINSNGMMLNNNYLGFPNGNDFLVPDVWCREFAERYFPSLFRTGHCMWEGLVTPRTSANVPPAMYKDCAVTSHRIFVCKIKKMLSCQTTKHKKNVLFFQAEL